MFKGEQDTAELSANSILMQTILAPNYCDFFFAYIFVFDANERICFCFKEIPTFT